MTKYKDLADKFNTDKVLLENFGNYIIEEVEKYIQQQRPYMNIEYFFKVKPNSRVKDEKSLIDKAFFRNKKYKDPYLDITDKVGVRFIVLTMDDVKLLEVAITNVPGVILSKDRDSFAERLQSPDIFTYQSDHYIMRPKTIINYHGAELSTELSCEVQARTLLQHAYAEVSHSTTYKPKLASTNTDVMLTKRDLARSSALVEITDEKFNHIMTGFQERTKLTAVILQKIHQLYSDHIDPNTGPINKSDEIIVESYYDHITDATEFELSAFYEDKKNSYIFEKIKNRLNSNHLYKKPSVLFLYFILTKVEIEDFVDLFPLGLDSTSELCNDLGKSIDQYIEH